MGAGGDMRAKIYSVMEAKRQIRALQVPMTQNTVIMFLYRLS